MPSRTLRFLAVVPLLTALHAAPGGLEPPRPAADGSPPSPAAPAAPAAGTESAGLDELLRAGGWCRRAVAAMRLESAPEAVAAPRLARLLGDPAWQVRAFAVAVIARRRLDLDVAALLAEEAEPRVIRAMLRSRVSYDAARLHRGVERLLRSGASADRLLGIELALASGDEALREDAEDAFVSVVMRLDAVEGGTLSPRLAAISKAPDLRRDWRWRTWVRKHRGNLGLHGAFLVPAGAEDPGWATLPPNAVATLSEREFLRLVDYLRELALAPLDLGLAIDATASMSGELAEVQGGLDDLMLFLGDATAGIRVGLVAYRDRQDRFEVVALDLTPSIPEARRWLWQLSAEGGGDHPESVLPALRALLGDLAWGPDRRRVAILVGDAPPHPGFGAACVELARRAAADGRVVHVISAAPPRPEEQDHDDEDSADAPPRPRRDDRRGPPEHFPEIAEAGGGRLVELADGDSLVAELVGLSVGGGFDEAIRGFFDAYLAVCR